SICAPCGISSVCVATNSWRLPAAMSSTTLIAVTGACACCRTCWAASHCTNCAGAPTSVLSLPQHSQLGLDELAVWQVQQLRDVAQQVFFSDIDFPVCIGNLPQHLHDLPFLLDRHVVVDLAQETVQ